MAGRPVAVGGWHDPLLRAIAGLAIALTVGLVALNVFGNAGRMLHAIPNVTQATLFALTLEAAAIAFIAFGRFQVLPQPMPFWIGLAMIVYVVGEPFVILSFPGLTPQGTGVIAQLPNTSSWLAYSTNVLFAALLLVAALALWPRSTTGAGRWWFLVVILTAIAFATRLLVEAHGGRIWVESEVGVGRTFSFSLPAATGSGEPSPTPAAHTAGGIA